MIKPSVTVTHTIIQYIPLVLEENRNSALSIVHESTENFRAVPQKVADGLDAEPGTHVGRTVFLVGELEIIEAESGTKKQDNDPVKDLEEETSESYGSVVLASANIA